MMKKRWIALYVENYSGVLAKIAGLFSAKLYNLNSLTVGPTEDPTMSRMTISVLCDDVTFEQIKKQLISGVLANTKNPKNKNAVKNTIFFILQEINFKHHAKVHIFFIQKKEFSIIHINK